MNCLLRTIKTAVHENRPYAVDVSLHCLRRRDEREQLAGGIRPPPPGVLSGVHGENLLGPVSTTRLNAIAKLLAFCEKYDLKKSADFYREALKRLE